MLQFFINANMPADEKIFNMSLYATFHAHVLSRSTWKSYLLID